jgi:hypothetical protein
MHERAQTQEDMELKLKNSDQRNVRTIIPMLRSIARELLERSHAIFSLESQARTPDRLVHPQTKSDHSLVARLANQRRELGLSVKELESLGWERDNRQPMQFRSKAKGSEEPYTWKPEDSYFFRSAQI